MSEITISDLDAELEQRLLKQASKNGRSLEEEVHHILRQSVSVKQQSIKPENLGKAIRDIVEPLGGIELDIPKRSSTRALPDFK